MKRITAIFAVFILSIILIACNKDQAKIIKFETNGGTEVSDVNFDDVYSAENLNEIKTIKTGYEFIGWYPLENLSGLALTDELLKDTVTLYAKWEIINYEIKYHLNGGENNANNPTSFTIEDSITIGNPQKDDSSFLGWFLDSDFNEEFKEITMGTTTPIELHARWILNDYDVTFYDEDGKTILETLSVTHGLVPTPTVTPTKAGNKEYSYVFNGWSPILSEIEGKMNYYATYIKVINKYDVSFYNEDEGTLLETLSVNYGEIPKPSVIPAKPATAEYSYVFDGWNETLSEVTGNAKYYATYTKEPNSYTVTFTAGDFTETKDFLYGEEIIFIPEPEKTGYSFSGWDSEYSFMPAKDITIIGVFEVNNYNIIFYDEDGNTVLETLIVSYDEMPEPTIIPNKPATVEYIYEFIGWDKEIVAAKEDTAYVAVYQEVLIGDKKEINPQKLNEFFGFDIYSLLPKIYSEDYFFDDSYYSTYKEVYLDIYDWSNDDANIYMVLLDDLLDFDDANEAWVVGDYFLYVFEDSELYAEAYYGITIYENEEVIIDPNPVSNLYYSFNLQNTTTSLTNSYGNHSDIPLSFNDSVSKVNIKGNYVANITNPPNGLDAGITFAATVKNVSNPVAYLEIDTLGTIISYFTFEIEAKINYFNGLKAAKIQVYNGSTWLDFAGGDFYSDLKEDKIQLTINNLNSSKFRLVFEGTSSNKNDGQFKLYEVRLYKADVVIESWEEVVSQLKSKFNDNSFNYLPEFNDLDEIKLTMMQYNLYMVSGNLNFLNNEEAVNDYIGLLISNGYEYDDDFSAKYHHPAYTQYLNDDLAYGVYLVLVDDLLEINIFKYDPVIDEVILNNLGKQKSINEFELDKFGKSGLPSKGVFDVLVIPIEIKGNPFPTDYDNKLDLAFNGTEHETGWHSVSSYYYISSYGLLDLTFDIAPIYQTYYNGAYYAEKGEDGDQYAIKEALLSLDSEIDFSKYDANNDGYIDSIVFVYSIKYSIDVDPWWAWVYTADGGYADNMRLDGKYFDYYFWASYSFLEDDLAGKNITVNTETYIHELGHLMGMPDFYQYEGDYFGPVGGFDMMDHNVGDHGPFNKLLYGWLEPMLAVSGNYLVTLDAYSTDADGLNNTLLIPYKNSNLTDGDAFDEYLLIMFYTPKGLYEGHLGTTEVLKDAGVVIYHIDARLNNNSSYWDGYFRNDNEGNNNYLIQILEADFNNSLPSDEDGIKESDILRNGTIDLSYYSWNQGGSINVIIGIETTITNTSTEVTINVNIK